MAQTDNKRKKTWKREIAVALFFWVGYLSHDIGNLEMVKVLVWPVAIFGAGAYGLDSASKQLHGVFPRNGPVG